MIFKCFSLEIFFVSELSLAYHREQNLIKSIISGLPSQNHALLALNCHNSFVKLRGAQFNQEKLLSVLNETAKHSLHTPEIAEHLLVCFLLNSCFIFILIDFIYIYKFVG